MVCRSKQKPLSTVVYWEKYPKLIYLGLQNLDVRKHTEVLTPLVPSIFLASPATGGLVATGGAIDGTELVTEADAQISSSFWE